MTFLPELKRLMDAATKGPCIAYVVTPQSAAADFYEPYSPWVSGGFPKAVQVGRELCIAADDMALIAYLHKHAPALAELVEACEQEHGTATHYDSECPICAALAKLNANDVNDGGKSES